jgi:hypothetical protein
VHTMQPLQRIEFAQKEVDRFHGDVDSWKLLHDDLQHECWLWEDLIAKGNFLFTRILDLDTDIQESVLSGADEFDPDLDCKIHKILAEWLEVACEIEPHILRLRNQYGTVDGGDELKSHIREARGILTPDNDFFAGDKLAELRDRAIEDNRAGLTEPMLGHDRAF